MALTDEKGRRSGRINILDLLIVLVIIALAGGVYIKFFAKENKAAVQTTKVKYDIEVKNVNKDYVDAINAGDPIRDSVKGNNLGIVQDKKVYPASSINMDIENGKFVKVAIPDLYDVMLTIEADAIVSPRDILVDGADIRVGKKLFVKGKGYANTCFVMKVSIGQ